MTFKYEAPRLEGVKDPDLSLNRVLLAVILYK